MGFDEKADNVANNMGIKLSGRCFENTMGNTMGKRQKKDNPELNPDLKIEYKDDAVSSVQLMKFILLAINIADKDPEEAAKIQENFLDCRQ
jgi:hypothetical protein